MTTALAQDDGDDDEFEALHALELLSERLIARRTEVQVLRNAGMTIESIARRMKVSPATIRKDIAVVHRDINNEQPESVIARHRAVIFDIQRANYPAMLRGDKDAATTILKALDREARLLGLDAPTRVLANISAEEFANEAARLIERINALDPETLKELERGRIIDAEVTEADQAVEPEPDDRGDPEPLADQPLSDDARGPGDPAPGGFSLGGLSDDLDGWSNID